jgi:hypothetical protein
MCGATPGIPAGAVKRDVRWAEPIAGAAGGQMPGMRGQIIPPEALITSPVTQRDSSEAGNTAALGNGSYHRE